MGATRTQYTLARSTDNVIYTPLQHKQYNIRSRAAKPIEYTPARGTDNTEYGHSQHEQHNIHKFATETIQYAHSQHKQQLELPECRVHNRMVMIEVRGTLYCVVTTHTSLTSHLSKIVTQEW